MVICIQAENHNASEAFGAGIFHLEIDREEGLSYKLHYALFMNKRNSQTIFVPILAVVHSLFYASFESHAVGRVSKSSHW